MEIKNVLFAKIKFIKDPHFGIVSSVTHHFTLDA
jgi:hypothetical protein